MFKDKYIRDNEKITLDETAKAAIKEKLRESSARKKSKINFKAILATALSVCLALGVILVAKNTAVKPTVAPEKALVASVTYDDIYNSVNKILKDRRPGLLGGIWDYLTDGGIMYKEFVTEDSATGTIDINSNFDATSDNENSGTNNQVDGVDEADIVKNDGRYIYSLSAGRLIITDTNSGSPKKVSEIQVGNYNGSVYNMFVSGNRLAVITGRYMESEITDITVYCIDDKTAPFKMATVSQSGNYHGARMIDGTVYLLSNHYIYRDKIDKDRPEEYVPCINSRPLDAECITMIDGFTNPTYLVISAIDMLTAQSTEKSAVLGGAENIYCNDKHLYYTFTNNSTDGKDAKMVYRNLTTIVKLAITKDKIATVATGSVKGRLLNQFSMDEYEDNLRVVTTVDQTEYETEGTITSATNNTSNALFILDKELKPLGSVEDLGKDERVYSVRFDKEVGYFVTFRETDPLFTVDLSDPKAPKVMSALKIPGFSEYLHPFGEGLLFGFGKNATDSGSVTGLKLSMFDVSDPYNVTEAAKELIRSDWSEASNDHKAIMVDLKKNIIAFTAAGYGEETSLYVYGYDNEKGFFLKNKTAIEGDYYFTIGRFVYIGDHFYLVTESGIYTFNLSDFAQLGYLDF